MNLAAQLERTAVVHRDRPALALGGRAVCTWEGLGLAVARRAGALRERLDLRPGERVALIMSNTPAYVELLYACWQAGLVVVPVNAKLHPRELSFILEDAGARVVFVTPDVGEAAARAAATTTNPARIIDVADRSFPGLMSAVPAPVAPVDDDDLAWLFYTSGTTGRPKGAMLTHRNLAAMAWSYFIDIDGYSPGGCLLHGAPMSHGSGLYIIPHVLQGSCQVVPESGGFDPAEILGLLEHWRGVSLFAAPTMIKRLVDVGGVRPEALANLRTIVYGGAPMHVAALEAAVERFGFRFAQLYGQGESPMTITGMRRETLEAAFRAGNRARLASAGTPQAVVEVRVVDADDRCRPAGEPGEIIVRGETVMKGYWGNPTATAEALRGGWLHTGDIGAFDEDGFLTLLDRSKDFIISGGSNIYPREVEEILLRHPGVSEVAVIGVPDEEWGESVLAFVVAAPAVPAGAGELDALCLENLARFKRPKGYRFVDRLPKNSYGKILKTELRAWARDEQTP